MTNKNNTIKTLKLLGRLAELVEIWQEPKQKHLKKFGRWHEAFIIPCFSESDNDVLINKPGFYYDAGPASTTPILTGFKFKEAWNHEITQTAFKKEVREVCLELIKVNFNICKIDPKFKHVSAVRLGMLPEELLAIIWYTLIDQELEPSIYEIEALCQKLGTSLLESEESK